HTDWTSCRFRDYANRTARVKDCVRLTPRNIRRIVWLPPTCAYRLLAEGRDLYWWHPLVSGDPETVHQAGISVRGRVGAGEDDVRDEELEDRIVSWPSRVPKAARLRAAKTRLHPIRYFIVASVLRRVSPRSMHGSGRMVHL